VNERRTPAPAKRRPGSETTLVSLGERMAYLQMLRVAFAAIVIAFGFFDSARASGDLPMLAITTAAYLAITAAVEAARRLTRRPGVALVGGMLLLDGLYLAWAMYTTGSDTSPLRLLIYLHLIAVTLLASYRTGLKIALWHSLLFFSMKYGESSGLLDVSPRDAAADSHATVVFTAFWLLALATAVFSAINERELRRRKDDLELLTNMATELEFATGSGAVADTLLESITESFSFPRGVVLAGPEGNLSLMAYRGPGDPSDTRPGVDAIVKKAWEGKDPLLVKRLADGDPRLSLLLPMARNLVVVPMFAEGHPVGVLVLEHGEGRIERRVVALLTQFAAHAALALRNAWLGEQVQKLADTDALTGLPNRRTFARTLEREVARAARRGEPLSLAMIDIDNFKKINDRHGHPAGDEVLRRVGRALKEECRAFDTPARFGGEEFAVVLPACTSKESVRVAERLRKGMARIGMDFEVTASAGIATFPTHAADAEALVRAADAALYESKDAGRDQTTRSRRRGKSKILAVADR
jgi:diguanylate cyclase (GGDEF)-like protein